MSLPRLDPLSLMPCVYLSVREKIIVDVWRSSSFCGGTNHSSGILGWMGVFYFDSRWEVEGEKSFECCKFRFGSFFSPDFGQTKLRQLEEGALLVITKTAVDSQGDVFDGAL